MHVLKIQFQNGENTLRQMMKSLQQGMATRVYMQIQRIQFRLNRIASLCISWNQYSILGNKNIEKIKTEKEKNL